MKLEQKIQQKDETVAALENKGDSLSSSLDNLEQYSRRQ